MKHASHIKRTCHRDQHFRTFLVVVDVIVWACGQGSFSEASTSIS